MAKPYQTLGFQFSGVYHVQDGIFGLRTYDATQKSLYFNSIYQDIIGNTDHQIRTGFSTQWDAYDEKLLDTVFKRNEIVPGVFGEYTYKGSEKFTFWPVYGLIITIILDFCDAQNECQVCSNRNYCIQGFGRTWQRTASIFQKTPVFLPQAEILWLGVHPPTNPMV